MRSTRSTLRALVGLPVAAVFLYLAFGRLEWATIGDILYSVRPVPLVLALSVLAMGFYARILRWWLMLRVLEPGLAPASCARPFLLSMAINNTVPLRAGDLYRAFGFREALRSPPMRVMGTLVVERILDLFVLLAFFFVGLYGVGAAALPAAFVTTGIVLGVACLGGIVLMVLAPHRLHRLVDRLLSSGPLARARWSRRAREVAGDFFVGLSLLQSPALGLQLLSLSLVAWALEGGVFALVAASLATEISPLAPWFSLATGTMATLLPSTPGYVGTFDYFAALGLVAYGASRASAAVFALLVHLVLWLPVTIVGALYLVVPQGAAMIRQHSTRGQSA